MRFMKPIIYFIGISGLSIIPLMSAPVAANPGQPYAGQEARSIKALSAKEMSGLKSGSGLGMAKAAELNQYPGMLHILELAERLTLSNRQRRDVESLYQNMKAEAVPLGHKIIAAEAALDQLFAKGTITERKLEQQVMTIARLKGRLRLVHLKYHLLSKPLLSPQQLALYNRLRGYDNAATHHQGHGKH